MEDPRSSPETFARWVETREHWHRDRWLASTAYYKGLGLYGQMADFAKIQSGESWVNLGCGFCDLEIAVLHNARPRVISVDSNPYMLMEAGERLKQNGFPVNLSCFNEVVIDGKPYSYYRIPKRDTDFEMKDDKVNVVFDDIRNFSLKQSLRGTIDVVTYSLTGVSRAAAAQYPLRLDFESGDYFRQTEPEAYRMIEIGLNVKVGVFKIAVQILKPGGRLIYIDRFDPEEDLYSQLSAYQIPRSLKKMRDTSTLVKEPLGQNAAPVIDDKGRLQECSAIGFFEFRHQPKQNKKTKKRDKRRR